MLQWPYGISFIVLKLHCVKRIGPINGRVSEDEDIIWIGTVLKVWGKRISIILRAKPEDGDFARWFVTKCTKMQVIEVVGRSGWEIVGELENDCLNVMRRTVVRELMLKWK